MNVCEAMNAYATNADWFSYCLFFILGFWKLCNLGSAFTRWVGRKVAK